MNKNKELARFEGPIYGLTLIHLAEGFQPYVVRAFNTASAVELGGYVEGQYHGHYFDTFEEAIDDFQGRVSSGLRDVQRQAREMEKKTSTLTGACGHTVNPEHLSSMATGYDDPIVCADCFENE